ncbi:MAG: dihydrofolate reductase [Gammaproteobacteria bacterium]
MAIITLVVAMDTRRGIGIHNQLPWRLPEDLAHFKRITSGHPIVMGRKTFDSIGRALPNRRNIVVTRNAGWQHDGVETAASLEAAIALCEGAPKVFVIGGGQIFAEAMKIATTIELTEIDGDFGCDTFFPEINPSEWQESARDAQHSEGSKLDYAFVTLERYTTA